MRLSRMREYWVVLSGESLQSTVRCENKVTANRRWNQTTNGPPNDWTRQQSIGRQQKVQTAKRLWRRTFSKVLSWNGSDGSNGSWETKPGADEKGDSIAGESVGKLPANGNEWWKSKKVNQSEGVSACRLSFFRLQSVYRLAVHLVHTLKLQNRTNMYECVRVLVFDFSIERSQYVRSIFSMRKIVQNNETVRQDTQDQQGDMYSDERKCASRKRSHDKLTQNNDERYVRKFFTRDCSSLYALQSQYNALESTNAFLVLTRLDYLTYH